MAFCRQRVWNSHSSQCRFRTRSGGVGLESSAAILSEALPHFASHGRSLYLQRRVVVAVNDFAEADLTSQRFREHKGVEG